MKVEVSEATGPVLDWMVAKCEGIPLLLDPMGFRKDAPDAPQSGWWVWFGTPSSMILGYTPKSSKDHHGYRPSTDWAQGGPIIEREEVCLKRQIPCSTGYEWNAWIWTKHVAKGGSSAGGSGPTPLIAAMRCFVASKLGNVVEIPEELK